MFSIYFDIMATKMEKTFHLLLFYFIFPSITILSELIWKTSQNFILTQNSS